MKNPDPLRGALAMTIEILSAEGHQELAATLREKWTKDLEMLAALMLASDQLAAETSTSDYHE